MKDTGKRILKKTAKGIWIATAVYGFAFTMTDSNLTAEAAENHVTYHHKAVTENWTANTVDEITKTIADQEAANFDIYIIQWGDTLSGISEATGTSIEELVALNNIENPDLIYTGDELDGVLRVKPNTNSSQEDQSASLKEEMINQADSRKDIDENPQTSSRENIHIIPEKSTSKETTDQEKNLDGEVTATSQEEESHGSNPELSEPSIKSEDLESTKSQTNLSESVDESSEKEIEVTEALTKENIVSSEKIIIEGENTGKIGEETISEPILEPVILDTTTEVVETETEPVEFNVETVRRYTAPLETKFIYDNNLDKGTEVVEAEGNPPYEVIEKRVEINEAGEIINESETIVQTVSASQKVVRIGTKDVAITEQTKEVVEEIHTIKPDPVSLEESQLDDSQTDLESSAEAGERVIVKEVLKDETGNILEEKIISNEITKEPIVEASIPEEPSEELNQEETIIEKTETIITEVEKPDSSPREKFANLSSDVQASLIANYYDERAVPEALARKSGGMLTSYGFDGDTIFIKVTSGVGSGHPVYKFQIKEDGIYPESGIVYLGAAEGYQSYDPISKVASYEELLKEYERNEHFYKLARTAGTPGPINEYKNGLNFIKQNKSRHRPVEKYLLSTTSADIGKHYDVSFVRAEKTNIGDDDVINIYYEYKNKGNSSVFMPFDGDVKLFIDGKEVPIYGNEGGGFYILPGSSYDGMKNYLDTGGPYSEYQVRWYPLEDTGPYSTYTFRFN